MADIRVDRKPRGPQFSLGWIGLGVLVLGVLIWLIYAFMATGDEPQPEPIDFERVSIVAVAGLQG